MLLALSRRYLCRTRGSSHALYLQLLSQFSSSSSGSTRSPSVPSSVQGQGTLTFSARFFSNTSITDWQAHSRPSSPIEDSQFRLDWFLDALHLTEDWVDDDEMCVPTVAVEGVFKDIGCPGFITSVSFVLQVLSTYGNTKLSLSSYLAVFEWAGEQPGFLHTPETFSALNKILADLNPILHKDLVKALDLEDLEDLDHYRARFYNNLLVAYLIAQLPGHVSNTLRPLLLEHLSTPASYHAVVDVLLQHKLFAEADAVLDFMDKNGQFSLEPNDIIKITPNLGGPNQWDQANKEYLRGLVSSGDLVEARFLGGHALITLVRDHCENKRFKDAAELMDEFKELGSFNSYEPFEIWITSAYKCARSYFSVPKIAALSDHVQTADPCFIRYTTSLIGLMTEKRFEEASQLLMEMKEYVHDETSASNMCRFLLTLLCGRRYESGVEAEQYHNRCCILSGAPYCLEMKGEGNFDRLIQAIRLHFPICSTNSQLPGFFRNFLYNKLISALCLAGRVEDAYAVYEEFNATRREILDGRFYFDEVISTTDEAYYHMIHGFRRINREDVADSLLLKMLNPRPTKEEGVLSSSEVMNTSSSEVMSPGAKVWSHVLKFLRFGP